MIRVLVESPFAGKTEEETIRNQAYARAAMKDCLLRGEAPLASHLLYTQPGVLDDRIRSERQMGIDAGLAWGAAADKTVVYVDLGLTTGMLFGVQDARERNRPVEDRRLPGWDLC